MKVFSGFVIRVWMGAHAELAEIPITTPSFWVDESACTDALLRHVFRSATDENMPLLQERIECLREAGRVLCKVRSSSVPTVSC